MRRTALLAMAFLLVACTGEPERPPLFGDAQQLTQAVSTALAQGKTAKFDTDLAIGGVRTTGRGQARFDAAGTALTMSMDLSGEPMELRLVDKLLYVKVPGADTAKPWAKLSADGQDPFSQAMGASLDQVAKQSDPARTVEQLRRAGTLVRGEHGDGVDHYWFDVDLARLGPDLPAGLSPEAVKEIQGKADRFPAELWVDAQRRPVQVSMDLAALLKAAGAPEGSPAKITAKYSDWGAAADVQAPPADQVGELPGS
ncbi:hypothetical protein AB5J62_35780 [Amycolatopsis sp. cg5]|uniref:hypothetical protein n=1 Tax=Amycolatopsis sp. cg5 TaxID=3238802 RepID=UPI00352426E5